MHRTLPHWRQFDCFTASSAPQVQPLIDAAHRADEAVYVVLTHSCSLVSADHAAEPRAEYIVGRPIAEPDPMCMGRRNPRKLHVALSENGNQKWFCFLVHERGFFTRAEILKSAPSRELQLKDAERDILLRWIVDRYQAPTFPDEFSNRLKTQKAAIAKALGKAQAKQITGLWVILDPDDEEAFEGPYNAEFILTYHPAATEQEIRDCETVKAAILKVLEKLPADQISLQGQRLSLLSEHDIRVSELRELKLILLDYLSERDVPGGPLPVAG